MKLALHLALFISILSTGVFSGGELLAQSQQGQANKDTNNVVPPKKKGKEHTLSFEDELVEGANSKPELFYLFQKKRFNYKRLIKLRENFLPEMKKTSEELQRSRSQY